MKIWLFEDPERVTDSWHSGGSVMIIAETRGQVEQLLHGTRVELSEQDWEGVRIFPTHSYVPAEVFIFPDSGCC
jgi:hypothetical protein